ncbi:hypothetical protein [Pontibacter harenae]|uniref:hypothetical protein n=1 Tax=Pontibacter harenae TaxID=2894083 RepID=UPI001E2913AF|nr:hypothetical protein [Pontibacter harenae]MCC9165953.1 hypothetical protein [Pontibacter harenae]
MDFEEMQKSWQMQQAPQLSDIANNKPLQTLLKDRVKALQVKTLWTNILMTVVLCLTAAAFIFILRRTFTPNTRWFDVGMVVMFGAILLSALATWLKSVPWKNLKADLDSRAYISHSLKSFRFQQTSIKLITPIQMVVSTIGLNLIYLDIFWNESWKFRLLMNLGLVAVMVLVGGLSLYYSKLRHKELYEPIIKELEELEQKLKAD